MGHNTVFIKEIDEIVIKFAGDSGDGMQLTGTQFSDLTTAFGNDLFTFPDYPSEIRAPQGTIAGVSGFQVHIGGKDIQTPGDLADILIAMNPAALKINLKWIKPGATIIIDIDNFDDNNYKKANYVENPFEDGSLEGLNVIKAPITSLSRSTISELNLGIDLKTADKTRNQFVMGMLLWLFNRDITIVEEFLEGKFGSKDAALVVGNKAVLRAGYNYAETVEAIATQFQINPAKGKKGKFRQITGNQAAAWGLIAGAEKAGLKLFLGSYPITPATDILQELCGRKHLGVKTFQAEDEIAGICTAIGASFGGYLGATSTSGPGLSLKTEACGLAVMTELPLVIIDVQRGGPSTGLPTKTEQSDLLQAIHGRHGESPMPVIAASTPSNCFDYAYMASKIAIEHMTPIILLTDGYLANGTELWKIPNVDKFPEIKPPLVKENTTYNPYRRDEEKLNRYWALPGQAGLEHRIGGLEKANVTGEVSHDSYNHQVMTNYRAEKVKRIANYIPDQEIIGNQDGGELLVIGWGGTFGALNSTVLDLREEGYDISLTQFNYICPLPKNTGDVLKKFKKHIVCELNLGQFADYLKTQHPQYNYLQFNKVQGLPFFIHELKEKFINILKEK